MVNHERWMELGKTVVPLQRQEVKELVEVRVDRNLGAYKAYGSTNSSDINLVTLHGYDNGYINIRNRGWFYKFHMGEWPVIEEYMETCPFTEEFSTGMRYLLSEKTWNKISSKYDDTDYYI